MKRLAVMTIVVLTGGLVAAAGAIVAGGASHQRQRGSVLLGGSPGMPVANPKTHTLYVPLQCRNGQNCQATAQHVLEIIDTSKCNPHTASGCRGVGRVQAGGSPLAAVIDRRTDTLYAADGAGAVSVVDGRRCNATVRTHCGVLATIKTGGFDVADVLNPRTHTLYVAGLCATGQPGPQCKGGAVFVINVARCNSITTRGCHQQVRKVKDPGGPDGIDVDLATNTIYTADSALDGSGHTVSVINGAACNGSTGRGCGRRPRKVNVGDNPFWVTVDQGTDTVYVPNHDDGTVSVINGAACNATVTRGCHRQPRAVATGAEVAFTAVDQSRHTLFVLNQTDDTVSELDTRTCNGHKQSGCPRRARSARVPFDPPTGYNPGAFALVPGSGTAYMVNVGGEDFLAAVRISRCTALTTAGCRVEAPSRAMDMAFPVVDPATDTIYAANASKHGIAVLNGATCNAHARSGCAPVATIPFAHPDANLGSIDHATHTLYSSDTFSDTVWAIDIQHCNAHDTSGCTARAGRVKVGPGPNLPQLNPSTHTLYVTAGKKENKIYVIDASTCNAQTTSGCGQKPATVTVDPNTYFIAVSTATDSVYAVGVNWPDDQLLVVNGARCHASDHSGCASAVVSKARTGLDPLAVAVDDSTHTVYVANNADGDLPGTVSVINGATCNGSKTTGCGGAKPAAAVGRSPVDVALATGTQDLYVADFSHAAVSIVDTSRCRAGHTSGCARPAREQAVGSQPGDVFVNPRTRTVYVSTHDLTTGGGAWSFFPTRR